MSGFSRQHMSGFQDSTCLVSQDSTCQGCQKHQQIVVSGTNVVAMARHGPILKDNEATGARKVFKYPGDLQDTINNSKNVPKVQKVQKPLFGAFSFLIRGRN